MEGEPVWLHTFSSSQKNPHFSMGNPGTCFRSQRNVYSSWLQQSLKKLLNDYGKTWVVYSRKPEEPLDQAVHEKKCVQVDRLTIIQKAKECLKEIKKYPVDVKEICKTNNIELRFSDLESLEAPIGVKIDAILHIEDGNYCIIVNDLLPSAFARYAIGQCLGHFFLHEEKIKTNSLPSPCSSYPSSPPSWIMTEPSSFGPHHSVLHSSWQRDRGLNRNLEKSGKSFTTKPFAGLFI